MKPPVRRLARARILAISRRNLLYLASASVPFLAAAASGFLGNYASTQVTEQEKQAAEKAAKVKATVEQMLSPSSDFFFAHSHDNPLSGVPGVSKPSTIAFQSLVGCLGLADRGTHILDEMPSQQLDGHAIFFGGPVANGYSRQLIGSHGYSPLLSLVRGKLACTFDGLPQPNSQQHERTKYAISIYGDHHHGTATTDYLLLTSLPNVFSPNHGQVDHRLFALSGLHSAGTSAVRLLVSQPELLNQVTVLTAGMDAWQLPLVVRVDPHSGEATAIERPVKAFRVVADFTRLARVVRHRAVQSAIKL